MFKCPYLQVTITKPCQARSCSLNVNKVEFNNCIMQHSTNDNSLLSMGEIAYYFNKPLSEVRETYKSALNKIYDVFIEHELENEIPTYYIQNDQVCLVNESNIEDGVQLSTGHVIEKSCLVYPKEVWEKAIQFSTTPQRLLELLFSKFSNSVIEKIFNLPNGSHKKLRELRG